MKSVVDIAVIGAGQAGLALAYYLQKQQRDFLLLEQASEIGSSWRQRYASLTLFTPRRYSALPGYAFPGAPDAYPHKDEVADYLKEYAQHWGFPIALNTTVQSVIKTDTHFIIRSRTGTFRAKQLVVATGPFQTPFVPPVAEGLGTTIPQWHSSAYHQPQQLPTGEVLVIGSGNSGLQIAEELLQTHPVHLAQGKRQPQLPSKLLGRSLFWWFERLGITKVRADTWLGRRLQQRDPIIGSTLSQLVSRGLLLQQRVVSSTRDTVIFADGKRLRPQSIIWATGFKSDYTWLHLPILTEQGEPRHQQGITEIEGLYFLGLSWQRSRGSALLGWVGEDAAWLASYMTKQSIPPAHLRTPSLTSLGTPH